MSEHACTAQNCQVVHWTYTVEQGTYNAQYFNTMNIQKKTSCTISTIQTMDDRTWIREDTLTMQLAIPLDLGIYNRHIYNDEMVQSNWCNRMTKDE